MPPSIANLLELSTPSSPRNTPVQAYAKLEFGAYSFYVQSLSVTLGRKAGENDHVDVHLGNTKAISRQHARVQYSFARNCFEIYVGGRNGLFVDDLFYEQGSVVPLDDRYFAACPLALILSTQIQIGEIRFVFLLPHQGAIPQESQKEEEEISEVLSTSATPTPPPPENNEPLPQKPDIPYATLIAQSLLSHPRRRRTLQEIYTWIQDHHAYFKKQNKSWQSSIRHNLMSSPAFTLYTQKDTETGDKKNKRGKDEWGISPEYEGLIGNLSAKEGDTDKLSTKLNKKKPTPAQSKPTPPPKAESPTTSPAPAPPPPAQTEDKSKLEELVKNMQGKGVDMGALLQEALAQMNRKNMKPTPTPIPQPPAQQPSKRPKPAFPPPPPTTTTTTNGTVSVGVGGQTQNPVTMPMPLPYSAAKVAPIPSLTPTGPPQLPKSPASVATAISPPISILSNLLKSTMTSQGNAPVEVKKEIDTLIKAPVPSPAASPPVPQKPPESTTTNTRQSDQASTTVETAASKRIPRGKKRSLEE